jgi:hypothetical protein
LSWLNLCLDVEGMLAQTMSAPFKYMSRTACNQLQFDK